MKEKVRTIVYVGNFKIADMNAAGKRVFSNAKLLAKCGYQTVVIGNDVLEQDTIIIDNIFVHGFETTSRRLRRFDAVSFFNVFKQIVNRYENVSHVICYGSPSLSFLNLLIIKWARKKKICVITDVVDWLSADSGNILFRLFKQADINFRNGCINRKFDKCIVISEWLRNYYLKSYKEENIIMIPPLVYSEPSATYPRNDVTQLVYAGVPFSLNQRITDYSKIKDRIDIMLRLLRSVKERGVEFRLNIYGFTKKELLFSLPELEEDVAYLQQAVEFNGRVPMDEVNRAIENADYTIFLREKCRTTMAGFPTKIVESISKGVPVITTKTSNMGDYLNEGREVFYLNPEKETEAVETLIALFTLGTDERDRNRTCCCRNKSFLIDMYVDDVRDFLN